MPPWNGWFARPKRAAMPDEAKDSRAGRLIALSAGYRAQWTPRDYESLAREGFACNAIAYRCVRMIAEAAASAPMVVFEAGVARAGPSAAAADRPAQSRAGASGPPGGLLRRPADRRQRLSGGGRRRDRGGERALRPASRPHADRPGPARLAGRLRLHRVRTNCADRARAGRLPARAAPEAVQPAGRLLRLLAAAGGPFRGGRAQRLWLLEQGPARQRPRGRPGPWSTTPTARRAG